MNVLLATMQFGPGYHQGTERYVAILAEGLRHRGHEVTILGGDPEGKHGPLKLGDPVPDTPGAIHYPSRGWMSVLGLTPSELRTVLNRCRPDLIHLANPGHIGVGLLDAASQAAIPAVATMMDFWWVCPRHTLQRGHETCDATNPWTTCVQCVVEQHPERLPRLIARLPIVRRLLPTLMFRRSQRRGLPADEIRRWQDRREVLRETLAGVDAVICPSRATRTAVAPWVDERRLHAVPYGLEPRWFRQERTGRAKPTSPEELVIGYAGALAEHKGVHLLLEAVARLGWTTTRIRLAGMGSAAYEARLRRLAGGLNVDFLGRVDSADMPAFLADLDVLVAPSTWPENLPIVALEAQAVGTPVLGSRAEGIAEMIPDDAHLFAVNSAAGLADCLDGWLAEPAGTPSHGDEGPVAVSTSDEMVDRTLAIYRRCRPGD